MYFILCSFVADIISCVEFNADGELLATGDKGGRVVIFQRDQTVILFIYYETQCNMSYKMIYNTVSSKRHVCLNTSVLIDDPLTNDDDAKYTSVVDESCHTSNICYLCLAQLAPIHAPHESDPSLLVKCAIARGLNDVEHATYLLTVFLL